MADDRVWPPTKQVLPDAFLLKTAKEELDHLVLLLRIRGDILLFQPVELTHTPKCTDLKDQAIITADHRHQGLCSILRSVSPIEGSTT